MNRAASDLLRRLAEGERFEISDGDQLVASADTYTAAVDAAQFLIREGGYPALAIHDSRRPNYPALATITLLPDGRTNTRTGDHARYTNGAR